MRNGYEEKVRKVANELGMLDDDGNLTEMDSLTVLDFVAALERQMGKTIPTVHIRRTNFESIEAITTLLGQLEAS